jgi:DNA-directed RNA polymerase subunit M/transcription elongation factor TFIIS
MENFIDQLTETEKETYIKKINEKIYFQAPNSIKDNISNLSHIYHISLFQNIKYIHEPTRNTIYIVPEDSTQELKTINNMLNDETDEDNIIKLSVLRTIHIMRKFNQSLVGGESVNYDKYKLQGETTKCIKCKGQTTLETRQKRSADEPSEIYYKCHTCRHEFKDKL